ncbi:MAG: FHA domain-containing protein [Pirellulales bacterium]|nr:FHA domain-containing protein [Pirellulales bacterium]
MDVVLKVLEGAKVGTKIAIKKEEFLIGRSPKCHLCAGSSSVSRKHCALTRDNATVFIRDLGSRNGTAVNGKKLHAEKKYELSSGDEITVGTLRFLVTISQGIKNQKRPQVKSVAEAVERTAESSAGTIAEDDISKWLLGEPGKDPQAITETQSIRMDDTKAVDLEESDDEIPLLETETDRSAEAETDEKVEDEDSGKGKEPGKLPQRPSEPASKDSREAAVQALRNWNRRR